jgi:hypothetical protein
MEEQIFLLPETQRGRRTFYASDAQKIARQPIPIPGFRSWLLTDSLDSLSSPLSLVAVPTPKKTARLYPVQVRGEPPNFESFGLTTDVTNQGIVVFLPAARLWATESKSLCIPMSVAEWKARSSEFEQIVALHRLSVIPSISKRVLKSSFEAGVYEHELNGRYGTMGGLRESLCEIFRESFLALRLFGFVKREHREIVEAISAGEQVHAFGDIRYAVAEFNSSLAYFNGQHVGFLTGRSYKLLVHSMGVVVTLLGQLGFAVSDPLLLGESVKLFQSQQGMKRSGICDPETLNALWTQALSHSLNPDQILADSGFGFKDTPPAVSELVEQIDDNPGRELLRARLNEMLGDLPDVRFAQLAVEQRLRKTVGMVSTRCAKLNERLTTIEQRTANGKKLMAVIADSTARCNEILSESARALDGIVRSHVRAQGKFEEIKGHVGFLRRTNTLMTVFGLVALIVFCLKVFHFYPFRS